MKYLYAAIIYLPAIMLVWSLCRTASRRPPQVPERRPAVDLLEYEWDCPPLRHAPAWGERLRECEEEAKWN